MKCLNKIGLILTIPFVFACSDEQETIDLSSFTNLTDTWVYGCASSGSGSVLRTLVITSSTMTETVVSYSDASCTTAYTTDVINWSLGSVTDDGYLPVLFTSRTYTPNTAAAATALDAADFCEDVVGDGVWADSTTETITSSTCTTGSYSTSVIYNESYGVGLYYLTLFSRVYTRS